MAALASVGEGLGGGWPARGRDLVGEHLLSPRPNRWGASRLSGRVATSPPWLSAPRGDLGDDEGRGAWHGPVAASSPISSASDLAIPRRRVGRKRAVDELRRCR
jgi:hypothetical protein